MHPGTWMGPWSTQIKDAPKTIATMSKCTSLDTDVFDLKWIIVHLVTASREITLINLNTIWCHFEVVIFWHFLSRSICTITDFLLRFPATYLTSLCLFNYAGVLMLGHGEAIISHSMKTSWQANAFCITGLLWEKRPLTSGSPHNGPVMQSFGIFFIASLKKNV